jgi:hypothetical protein
MEKNCLNCKWSNWCVGIGLGFFCTRPENEGVKFNENCVLYPKKYPQIPSRSFVCDFHELEDSKPLEKE